MENNISRYHIGFALYWLVFAVLAVIGGTAPGFVPHPELTPYPWKGVICVSILLAFLVTSFYYILRPPAFRTSWLRLTAALSLGAALLVLSFLTCDTDMPGFYYVPHLFALLTMLVLLVAAGSTIVRRLASARRIK